MNKDDARGTIDDAAGWARRQPGEWTGNTEEQVKGATQQVKGKVEEAWANVKDATRDAERRSDRDRYLVVERDVLTSRGTDDDDLDRP